MSCTQKIVQQDKGLMKIYTNQTNIYEGSTAVVEHKEKDQAAGLEMGESFILCRCQNYKTHIKSIAMFHEDQVEVACGCFTDKGSNIDLTQSSNQECCSYR
jgi:hypothetical protein